ncbi:MAG TPA: hypothetical protein PKO15_14135, partial [Fibrobacteria bacterium]|nr:hypothetical protein [Fibrobacteria bacterium]
AWPNHSQPGRNLAVTSTVAWQTDSTDPLSSGIVSKDTSEMLSLGTGMVSADLSRISVRLRFLQGWMGWARLLRITDSAGGVLVELVRSGDSLKVSAGGSAASTFVPQDTLWHRYTWMRTASDWRVYIDTRHLLTLDDPSLRPAGVTLAEGGRIRMSEMMLWADTTVRETVPVGGIPVGAVALPVR